MIEPVVEKSIQSSDAVTRVFISKSGDVVLVRHSSGYLIIHGDTVVSRESEEPKVQLVKDRNIVVVAEGKNLSFYNMTGTLVWKSSYEHAILDVCFVGNTGVVLLENYTVLVLSGFNKVMGTVSVREDAHGVEIESSERFFAVVGAMGVELYSAGTLTKEWTQEFMEELYGVVLYRGASRIAVSLLTGDFYLINRNGKRILEYKFKEPPKMVFDTMGNVVIAEDESIRIMNDRGTLLKAIQVKGKCLSLSAASGSDYIVCGTDTGMIYFFNRSEVLWRYLHKESVYAVDISAAGEYIVAANREIMVFSNLAYYLRLLQDTQKKLMSIDRGNPAYPKLYEVVKKMKSAYLKKDFRVMLNLKKVFDGVHEKMARGQIAYALILDSLFTPIQISKNLLYVKCESKPTIKIYGAVRYRVVPLRPRGKIRRYSIIIQPKIAGTIPVKVEIGCGATEVTFTTRIYADGVPRKKRVLSNTNYRELIS